MSGGVVMYGAPGVPGWPSVPSPFDPALPVAPFDPGSTGRTLDFLRTEKRKAVVAVCRRADGVLCVKITVDGQIVSEVEVAGESTVLTVAL